MKDSRILFYFFEPQIMKRVIHLIPYDGIGGVEVAANSLPSGIYECLEFRKHFLAGNHNKDTSAFEESGVSQSLNNPWLFFRAVRLLIRLKPTLVIASLWRSCVVLVLLKLARPRTKTVVFLHYTKDLHLFDKVFTRMAMALATEIWTDSVATQKARIPNRLLHLSRVISFMVEPVIPRSVTTVRPKFIFWGRLQAQKRLDFALELFAQLKLEFPSSSFAVIGPDRGQKMQLLQQVDRLGLGDSVEFYGPMSRSQIIELATESSFYLQTSVMEGMAMSVVEAMQLGLVPVVTPVGEIANYSKDGENAIFVSDIQKAVLSIRYLIENPTAYFRMSSAAQAVWQGRRLYRDDVIAAASEILNVKVLALSVPGKR